MKDDKILMAGGGGNSGCNVGMLTLFPLHKHIGFQVVPTKMIIEIEIKITLLCITTGLAPST